MLPSLMNVADIYAGKSDKFVFLISFPPLFYKHEQNQTPAWSEKIIFRPRIFFSVSLITMYLTPQFDSYAAGRYKTVFSTTFT